MKTSIKKWSKKEIEILQSKVHAHPKNLTLAFELCAEEIGRAKTAVAFKWYNTRNQKGVRYSDNLFGLIGNEGLVNSKNVAKGRVTKPRFVITINNQILSSITISAPFAKF